MDTFHNEIFLHHHLRLVCDFGLQPTQPNLAILIKQPIACGYLQQGISSAPPPPSGGCDCCRQSTTTAMIILIKPPMAHSFNKAFHLHHHHLRVLCDCCRQSTTTTIIILIKPPIAHMGTFNKAFYLHYRHGCVRLLSAITFHKVFYLHHHHQRVVCDCYRQSTTL